MHAPPTTQKGGLGLPPAEDVEFTNVCTRRISARVAINLVSPCGRGGARRRRGASSGRREWCLAAPRARGSIAFQPVIMNFFAGDENLSRRSGARPSLVSGTVR